MSARTPARRVATGRGARTNLALLASQSIAFLTGSLSPLLRHLHASLVVHAAGGFAIVALLSWKSMIASRGLSRQRPGRWASFLLGILVMMSLLAGAVHSTGLMVYWGSLTAMEVHVGPRSLPSHS